jgi:hypothetical protein
MRNLFKNPLTWMILGESAVLAALILVAWHLIAVAQNLPSTAFPLAVSSPASSQDPGTQASAAVPKPITSIVRQLPGLNVDTGFWRSRLLDLNRDEAGFEALEWRIVHSAMDTIQRYTESVVLPSVEGAERAGG